VTFYFVFGEIESYSLAGLSGTRSVQLLVWRLAAGLRPPGDSHQHPGPLEGVAPGREVDSARRTEQ